MAVKTAEEIQEDIHEDFRARTGENYKAGSVLDMFTGAVSAALAYVHKVIEENKNPHLWTELRGDTLDATGVWVNCPRETNETDLTYKYRLMNWMKRNEASNTGAIQTALLNLTNASNATYTPMTHGCGTGTVYIIPNTYTQEVMTAALKEVKEKLADVISPSLYLEYVIPAVRSVTLEIYLSTELSDEDAIKSSLEAQIKDYVNDIAPKDYLEVGKINKLGVNTDNVDYFSVMSVIVDGESVNKLKILQGLDTKLLFDSITWIGDE